MTTRPARPLVTVLGSGDSRIQLSNCVDFILPNGKFRGGPQEPVTSTPSRQRDITPPHMREIGHGGLSRVYLVGPDQGLDGYYALKVSMLPLEETAACLILDEGYSDSR